MDRACREFSAHLQVAGFNLGGVEHLRLSGRWLIEDGLVATANRIASCMRVLSDPMGMDKEVLTYGQFAYPCVYAAICHILVNG